ncbi:hypothetical protein SAMD00019534_077470, partial [Acytostelium subglobosum LB1]|uniref:hypothetical protein n=1 Tax=Acytostelium subglobosum LB1 TaxID=1410327 RepID=UPI0006450ABC
TRIPDRPANPSAEYLQNEGQVYLLRYPMLTGTAHHFSVMIDLRAQSDDLNVTGLEFHLIKGDSQSEKVRLYYSYRTRGRNIYNPINVGKLGQVLQNDACPYGPVQILQDHEIVAWVSLRFSNFIKSYCHQDNHWGVQCNCQTFARSLIGDLGLQWPADVQVTSVEYPWVMQWAEHFNKGRVRSHRSTSKTCSL